MIYPSIDKLLNVIDSKYTLVTIAANRSREIKRTNFLQMPKNKYKYVKNLILTDEELTKTTTLKIKRNIEMEKILNK